MRKTPGGAAPSLPARGHKSPAGLDDVVEIERHVVRAGAHQRLGGKRVVAGKARAPGAAMHEDVDRRMGRLGAIDVEALDGAFAVRKSFGGAQALPRELAGAREARQQLIAVR